MVASGADPLALRPTPRSARSRKHRFVQRKERDGASRADQGSAPPRVTLACSGTTPARETEYQAPARGLSRCMVCSFTDSPGLRSDCARVLRPQLSLIGNVTGARDPRSRWKNDVSRHQLRGRPRRNWAPLPARALHPSLSGPWFSRKRSESGTMVIPKLTLVAPGFIRVVLFASAERIGEDLRHVAHHNLIIRYACRREARRYSRYRPRESRSPYRPANRPPCTGFPLMPTITSPPSARPSRTVRRVSLH